MTRSISDHSGTGTVGVWILAVLFCAVSAPLLWVVPDEVAKGNRLALLGLALPLAGLGLVAYAFRLTLAHWRYGSLAFEPDPDPAMVGGMLGGRIALPVRVGSEREVELTLTCWKVSVRDFSSNEEQRTEREDSIVWQREGRPIVKPAAGGSLLLFRFALPDDVPPGDDSPDHDGAHRWTLSVSVDSPGISLHRRFDVPVATRGTTGTAAGAEIVRLPEASTHGVAPAIPAEVVTITRSGNGIELHYPPLRDRGLATVFGLIGTIFAGSVWLMHSLPGKGTVTIAGVSRSADGMPWILLVVFSAVGIGLVLLAAFLLCNSLRVRIDASGVSARRSLLGFPLWERRIERAAIDDIVPEIAATSRGGLRPKVVYRLWATVSAKPGAGSGSRRPAGMRRRVLVGVSLTGSALMERLRTELRNALWPGRAGPGT